MNLERIFLIRPAFDKRDPDPRKDYGIHGAEMLFVLKGEKGAVQFMLYTNWQLPHVSKEHDEKVLAMANKLAGRPLDQTMLNVMYHPLPADVGYHSPVPMYEGQKPIGATKILQEAMMRNVERMRKAREKGEEMDMEKWEKWEETSEDTGTFTPCEWLDGKPCYYDGSGLAAQEYFKVLVTEGSEAVWKKLEEYYKETFHEEVSEGG